jgi:hypothetical protein
LPTASPGRTALSLANDPGSAISKLPIAEKLKVRSKADIEKVYLFLGASILKKEPIKELIDSTVLRLSGVDVHS